MENLIGNQSATNIYIVKKKTSLYQEYYVGIINKMSSHISLFVNHLTTEAKVWPIEPNATR